MMRTYLLAALLLATAGLNARASPVVNAPPATQPAARELTQADFDRHAEQLRRKLPSAAFTVVIARPFVVVGDEPAETVNARAERVVRWAVVALKREYFERDPDEIIDVWLFKDEASYRTHARKLWGAEPGTPFGYYSPSARAMVMNIATGGGTLVHEIVHPFVRANFPRCPAWFNEGLGSLYEQSGERDGRIVGYTNWRLAGLQRAIKAGNVPSFAALTSTTDEQFYGESRGVNYAAARYLCYYLQERGLLSRFYREFRRDHEKDPTGHEALRRVLGEKDMAAFQKNWETFVLGLKFP